MQQQALSAIVAWVKLDRALQDFEKRLKGEHAVTLLQLAVLHILTERPHMPLSALRRTLVMHPATLGQSIDDLRRKRLCRVTTDPEDRRARHIAITETGLALVEAVPLAGPMRLRQFDTDPARLDRLTSSLTDAMALFGLEESQAPSPG